MLNMPQKSKTALLLIDWQLGFDLPNYWGGPRNNPHAEANTLLLLQAWRKAGALVCHAKHNSINPLSPLHPTHSGNQIKPELAPLANELCVEKNVNSAFIGTTLQHYLQEQGVEELVVAGLTTDHCVSTTVRMAANFGFRVRLAADACATFGKMALDGTLLEAEQVHQVHLASLHNEFAQVQNTQHVIAQLG